MSTENQQDLYGEESFSDKLLEHLDEIPEPDADNTRKWPKDLAALINIFQHALERMGKSQSEAKKITHLLLAEQASYCGGRHIYMPKGDRLKQAIRDAELFRDWHDNGTVPDELARKYRISTQHVYRIIKEQRRLHMEKVQPGLF